MLFRLKKPERKEKMSKKQVLVTKNDGSSINVYVTSPTAIAIQKADIYRAKVWNECLDEGIKTKEELAVVMEKRGIWGKSQIQQELKIVEQLTNLERDLYLGDGKKKIPLSDGKNIAFKMKELRSELRRLLIEKNNFEQNTAENISDNARFDYLVSACTFYENGQKVYNNIEDYNNRASDEIAYAAAGALAEMMYSYDPSSEQTLPENQWLKHFNLVNEEGQLVDNNEKLVDLDGRTINELGHYINAKGERTDRDGNLLDENGNYIIKADYVVPIKRKKRTVKKVTES
jgi:hypothetical protein